MSLAVRKTVCYLQHTLIEVPVTHTHRLQQGMTIRKSKLENVSIAKALQLEAARRRAVPIRFNFVARAKFELAQPIRCHLRAFFLLIRYVTL